MCGIAGAIWSDPRRAVRAEQLARMTEVLRHRGPDDDGSYRSELKHREVTASHPGVALGFRRLAIIDLQTGNQPICNEDESIWVVFNGEIYNYQSLRKRLEGSGHRFQTQGDAETIVHLYEESGVDCFAQLNGMFAIAIWDAKHRRLILARDRLGQKPLVYAHQPGRLAFASELKSLRELPDAKFDLSFAAIDAYLTYQYVPHPQTIYQGVSKLPPASFAVYQDDKLKIETYWQPDPNARFEGSEMEAVEQTKALLDDSIALRMQSDVPLGTFLSGGVDSSIIAARMQQASSNQIKTFSIGFGVAEYDESGFAAEVASALGTDHTQQIVKPDAVEILDQLVWHFDEPFADSSAIPTWYLSEMTRKSVTVCLSGDGGDELFLGYRRYRAASLAGSVDRFPLLRTTLGGRWLQKLPASARQKSKWRQFKRFCQAIGQTPVRRYADWIAIFNESRRADLYNDAFVHELGDQDPVGFLQQAWGKADQRSSIEVPAWTDLATYLPCDLMTKVDIATMAHSLECRQPFLDYRLIELALSLPKSWHFRNGKGKHVLKKAFAAELPRSVFRRPKMGFGVPLDHWFRHELKPLTDSLLLSDSALTRQWFRPESVHQLVKEHQTGVFDHAYRLWALLILEKWLRKWAPT